MLGPQDSTTIIAEEVTMRFIHADQELIAKVRIFLVKVIITRNFAGFATSKKTEEDAEEEDEMMGKIKRQVEYLSFFNGKKISFYFFFLLFIRPQRNWW